MKSPTRARRSPERSVRAPAPKTLRGSRRGSPSRGPHWPRSIRARLALWYTAVFASIFLLFGGAFYLNMSSSLASSLDTRLAERTAQITAGISYHGGRVMLYDVTGTLPGLSSGTHDLDDTGTPNPGDDDAGGSGETSTSGDTNDRKDAGIGTLVRILDTQGRQLYVTPAFRALRVPSESVSTPLDGGTWRGTISTSDGQMIRLYSAPLRDSGAVYGAIQVGEPLEPVDATLRTVALEWLLLTPFVLAIGAGGGYWLAARAFRPIDRLTSTARRIEAEDLHQRVAVPRTGDALERLGMTLNEMIARLDDAFSRQRRFVADASHELATPVAAIRSLTEVTLAERGTAADYETALRGIAAESERLGRLIADLLALARADEGRAVLERELVRLDILAREVAAVMEPLAGEHHITVIVEAEQAVTAEGDGARLIQVVLNLLDNAIRYTGPGGTVRLTVLAKGDTALLSVQDTGMGITQDDLPHIFERFYRADPARSRATGGTGLGLSIVDWVVRAHGGRIDVASEVGKGSTFTITLPVRRGRSATQ